MQKIYRSEDVAMLNRMLFGVTVVVMLIMTLIGRESLNELYLFVAQVLPIDPVFIRKHATDISNIGHFVSCFILTCFAHLVFRESWLKIILCVAGVAVLGEFLQSFSATRQANLEDIFLSLSGIFLAFTVVFFIKRNSFAVHPSNQ